MWQRFLLNLSVFVGWPTCAFAADGLPNHANAKTPIRVLVVTGVDYSAHKWKQTGPVVRDLLEQDKQFEARIIEEPEMLASEIIFDYDVIFLHFKNYQPYRRETQVRENLTRFVRQGGGLAVLHFACGAFPGWPEFENLVGKVWDEEMSGGYHDPRGPFTVEIAKVDHPITLGMKDFQTNDELYYCLKGKREVSVLATARSKVTGKDHPMAFVFKYGKGRVFHTPLGHDVEAIQIPGVRQLLRRGTAWTAGRMP
jgi:type 1 glutamine amidotransferase